MRDRKYLEGEIFLQSCSVSEPSESIVEEGEKSDESDDVGGDVTTYLHCVHRS